MKQDLTRRELLAGAGALLARPAWSRAAAAPTARVAVARCKTYGPELVPAMERMFDQLGGLGGLVKGKTVAVKINLIGVRWQRLGNALMEDTFWTNPQVIGATVRLMGKAGARRIRVVEGPWSTTESLQEVMYSMNWKPQDILSAASNVEFENTNYLGQGKKYSRFMVPGGGLIYPGYDLNHSYEDCDVFVSLAKMKEHAATGITLSMKNVYGTTPITIYGQDAGVDEPSLRPHGGRGGVFHSATRLPSKSAPQQKDMSLPKDAGFRLPRIIAELNSARPVHLAIIDGVKTATGCETNYGSPSRPQAAVNPGVLIAGTNCVATDAVAMSVMGFNPMADRGTPPFATSDSMLRLAEDLGVGVRDLGRNEVVGTPIKEVVFDYTAVREKLLAAQKKG
ncbi:MAG: DUF362 domain-containing protein [Bryobacteraceae bacterium]|jgi:uncharacterized protein (DUF362 family)